MVFIYICLVGRLPFGDENNQLAFLSEHDGKQKSKLKAPTSYSSVV